LWIFQIYYPVTIVVGIGIVTNSVKIQVEAFFRVEWEFVIDIQNKIIVIITIFIVTDTVAIAVQ